MKISALEIGAHYYAYVLGCSGYVKVLALRSRGMVRVLVLKKHFPHPDAGKRIDMHCSRIVEKIT